MRSSSLKERGRVKGVLTGSGWWVGVLDWRLPFPGSCARIGVRESGAGVLAL